jgi:hypothetical protein
MRVLRKNWNLYDLQWCKKNLRLSLGKVDPHRHVHRHSLGGLRQLPVDPCRQGKRNLLKNKKDGSLH